MATAALDSKFIAEEEFEQRIIEDLSQENWHLHFSPSLENRYEASHNQQRKHELILFGVIALLIYNAFLLNDWLTRPEIITEAIFWRGIATLYAGTILWIIYKTNIYWLRETLMTTGAVVITFCSGQILSITTNNVATYDPFVFSLIFLASNALLPLRFPHAVWSTFVNIVITLVIVLNHQYIQPDAVSFIIGLLIATAIFSLLACYRLEKSYRQAYLLKLLEEIQSSRATKLAASYKQLSLMDSLTQLPNRRCFEQHFETLSAHNKRDKESRFALLLVDIDFFKRFNDSMGHIAGDACLIKTANIMSSELREGDFIARYGGEEFIILLPKVDVSTTSLTCERLRETIEKKRIEYEDSGHIRYITISIGATIVDSETDLNLEEIIHQADIALYQAKETGRNRSVITEMD